MHGGRFGHLQLLVPFHVVTYSIVAAVQGREDVTFVAMAPRTLYTVLEETTKLHGAAPALFQPTGDKASANRYSAYSWLEYRDHVQQVACALHVLGIRKGDFIALHSEPSAKFYMADLGIIANGSISAALYTSLPPADHVRTLEVVAPKALVAEDPKTMRALRSVGIDAPVWILLEGEAE